METGGVGRGFPVPPEDVMSDIIHFDLGRRVTPLREPREGELTAQILFFTGVRYTAYIEPAAPTLRGRRPAKPTSARPRKSSKQA